MSDKPKARTVAMGTVFVSAKLPKFDRHNNALVIVFEKPQDLLAAIRAGVLVFKGDDDNALTEKQELENRIRELEDKVIQLEAESANAELVRTFGADD